MSSDTKSNSRITDLLEEWQKAEDDIIINCEKMFEATDNDVIKATAEIIKADSARHKEVLIMLGQAVEGKTTLRHDELCGISGLIEEHLEIERKAVGLALEEFESTGNLAMRLLLFYLLEDEKKHFMLLTMLAGHKK